MSTPIRASDRDLRALAAIVSQDRHDLPDGAEGLPLSLLADLMDQIRCDEVSLECFDSGQLETRFLAYIQADAEGIVEGFAAPQDMQSAHWRHYWDCLPCSYPDRTGDLRGVVMVTDFYSARQWHSTGMYCDMFRPQGYEHELMLTLPAAPSPVFGPGRTVRLFFLRGPGADFSERDRALLMLLRPHLHQAYLDVEHRRHPVPRLTPRQKDLLRLLAAGHTNTQIARRLGISEGTVRTHLENIYEKLNVSSRTAAVIRAFPDRVA
jgi:DNA-binding CsgD family transcriptional regulator